MGWNEEVKKTLNHVGTNVFIGENVVFLNPKQVILGDHVRIDPFTIVSGNLLVGSYVQIMSHVVLSCSKAPIILEDWTFIGYHSRIFTASEDYSGNFGPVNNYWSKYNKVDIRQVHIKKHGGIASNCTIMPGVTLPEGCCIGADSFVYKNEYHYFNDKLPFEEYSVYVGKPLRLLKNRNKAEVIKIASQVKLESLNNAPK